MSGNAHIDARRGRKGLNVGRVHVLNEAPAAFSCRTPSAAAAAVARTSATRAATSPTRAAVELSILAMALFSAEV